MNIFNQKYAEVYDLIHANKDYQKDILQLSRLIEDFYSGKESRILDFGCGTGRHLIELRKLGYNNLVGYDVNEFMIDRAKTLDLDGVVHSKLNEVPNQNDFVYSLFDVLSYQVTDSDVEIFLQQILSLTKLGGVILLDGWNLSGVVRNPAENRKRALQLKGMKITRKVLVEHSDSVNITNLRITLEDESRQEVLLTEKHKMRAFSREELIEVISHLGGIDLVFMDGNDYKFPLTDISWRFALVFRKGLPSG
jgi:SAM-dependent methyltransferase